MKHPRDLDLADHAGGADIRIAGNDIAMSDTIAPAIRLSILSDRRDPEPTANTDPRGWWAKDMGSLLWKYRREKTTEATRLRIKKDAERALAWLLESGEASELKVSAEYSAPDKILLRIEAAVGNGTITETLAL